MQPKFNIVYRIFKILGNFNIYFICSYYIDFSFKKLNFNAYFKIILNYYYGFNSY